MNRDYSVTEVAKLCGLSRAKAHRLIAGGQLEPTWAGVDAWLGAQIERQTASIAATRELREAAVRWDEAHSVIERQEAAMASHREEAQGE